MSAFSRFRDTWNGLQIGDELHVIPAAQQLRRLFGNRPTDLRHQPTAGPQDSVRLGDQSSDHFGSVDSRKYSVAWLKLANFELHFVRFRFPHVGRIGNNEIKR